MQVAAVIVLAAVLFIAANYYTSRFGNSMVGGAYACIRARSRVRVVAGEHAFRPLVAACIYRVAASQPEQ